MKEGGGLFPSLIVVLPPDLRPPSLQPAFTLLRRSSATPQSDTHVYIKG
jgi:hypothetical protein